MNEIRRIRLDIPDFGDEPFSIVQYVEELMRQIEAHRPELVGSLEPALYDIANLLGCVGVEEPEALTGELARELIVRLREDGPIAADSWQRLSAFIVAIRFAWLSEWFRRRDEEMIALELGYMALRCTGLVVCLC
ncbi:MAG: hypothetical protein FJZ90_00810 [Chloroflexi bacterium]|nr:hypothetical protein [Chloroflexota bacterium]